MILIMTDIDRHYGQLTYKLFSKTEISETYKTACSQEILSLVI